MTADDPAEPILRKVTPDVLPLVQQLRALIKEVMPRASERAHPGWGTLTYCASGSMRDFVVAIAPKRAYANLEFHDGTELPDPAHRLEGTGKRLRHVKIRTPNDVRHPDVRRLLETAARRRGA
jgi:hypothetical protein